MKILFISLGVGFTVSGIIFFFAYNWNDLDKFLKIGLMQLLLAGSVAVVLHPKVSFQTRQIVLTGASLLVGALFAVFGQIYQTGANAYDFFLNWTIFIALWAIISQFPPLWLIFIALINTTFMLYSQQVADWMEVFVYTILFLFNSVLVILFLFFSKKKKYIRVPNWFLYVIALAAVCFSIFGFIYGTDMNSGGAGSFEILIFLSLLLYPLGIGYGLKVKNGFYLVILSLSILLIIITLWLKYIEGDDSGILLCLFIIISVVGLIAAFVHLQKQWKNET